MISAGITEQILVVLELVQLVGEGLNLLDLVVDHLDVLRDFLRGIDDSLDHGGWVVNHPLSARRQRDADTN
jgi:hypothetical protein